MTSSHRNLHTVGHLMLKQSSLNARTSTAEESGQRQNITFTIGKTNSNKNTDVRNSIKNGGKRRANSNTTTADKKVNLDKFLCAVQQRSKFTPAN